MPHGARTPQRVIRTVPRPHPSFLNKVSLLGQFYREGKEKYKKHNIRAQINGENLLLQVPIMCMRGVFLIFKLRSHLQSFCFLTGKKWIYLETLHKQSMGHLEGKREPTVISLNRKQ